MSEDHEIETICRYSSAVGRAYARGKLEVGLMLEKLAEACEKKCEDHGVIDDPIVAIVDGEVGLYCPHCSSFAAREIWETEGLMQEQN